MFKKPNTVPTSNDKGEIISKDELLTGEWTPFRNEVWSSSVLSAGAKVCYVAICSHIWKGGETSAWPGQKRLADLLSVTDRSVRNYLSELEGVGLITVERRGLNQTNVYYLHKPNNDCLKSKHGTDRKILSAQDRKCASAQDRNEVSYEEEAVEEETLNNNHPSAPVSGNKEPLAASTPKDDDLDKSKDSNQPSQTSGLSKDTDNDTPEEYDTKYFDGLEDTLRARGLNISLVGGKNFRSAVEVYEAGVSLEYAIDTINNIPGDGVLVDGNGKKVYSFEYLKTTILNKWNDKQDEAKKQQEKVEYYSPENIRKRREALLASC